MAKDRPISELFAWRSPSLKALGLETEAMTRDDLVRLMLLEPRLIRRPMVRIGDRLVVGGSEKELAAALAE